MSKQIQIKEGMHVADAAGQGRVLTHRPLLGWMLRRGYLMTALRTVTLLLFVTGVATGLWLEDARVGLATLLMWGIFWPLFTSVVTPSLGNVYCGICPHGFVGKWLSRIGLRKVYPRRLRGVWVGLVVIVLAYWVVAYAMPGSLSASTKVTAWYFLVFTVLAFTIFFIYRDMAWCQHVCPLGRVLATHGKVGVLQIDTDASACQDCKSFECAKACSYHLSPFRFAQRNNMEACTLCGDCLTACEHAHLVGKRPGVVMRRPVAGQDRHEMWVFLIILGVAGVGIQFLHGLQHTPLKPYLPWTLAGEWLHARVALDASLFNLGRFLALVLGIGLTVLIGLWAYRQAARLAETSWREAANTLALGLAPLAIIGLIPHAVTTFATRNAHALGNEIGALAGLGWQLTPLAERGDAWIGWLALLPYAGMVWTLWLIWQRASLLVPAGSHLRLRIWLYGSAPALLYISIFLTKVLANWLMPGVAHHHH